MSRPDCWVPAMRALEDITALPRQTRPGRVVIACPPCDAEAWQAGADHCGIDVVVLPTPGLDEGDAITWNALVPGPSPVPNFDRYYREESR